MKRLKLEIPNKIKSLFIDFIEKLLSWGKGSAVEEGVPVR
jgi:hypothetical protein